jgi:hypothetical protein
MAARHRPQAHARELGVVRLAHAQRDYPIEATLYHQQRPPGRSAQWREPVAGGGVGTDLLVIVGPVDAERPLPADQVGGRGLGGGGGDQAVAGEQGRKGAAGRGAVGVDLRAVALAQVASGSAGGENRSRQVVERIGEVVGLEAGGDRRAVGERFEGRVLEEEGAAVDQQQLRRRVDRYRGIGRQLGGAGGGRREREQEGQGREQRRQRLAAARSGTGGDDPTTLAGRGGSGAPRIRLKGRGQLRVTAIVSSWPSIVALVPSPPS